MANTILRICSQSAPLLIAAFAALFSEYAGMLNIGIEGFMLIGAFSAIATAVLSGSFFGTAAGIIITCMICGLFISFGAYLALKYRANIYVIGLAANLLAAGLVSALSTHFFGNQSIISMPTELSIDPFILKISIAIITIILSAILLWGRLYTKAGIRLTILGTNTEFLDSVGVNTKKLKMIAMGISGALAVFAGSLLSLQLGAFVPNQSGGRGWIALILIYAGSKSIIGTICATTVFVIIENSIAAAQIGVKHPAVLIGLPFILGLLLIIAEKIIKRVIRKIILHCEN